MSCVGLSLIGIWTSEHQRDEPIDLGLENGKERKANASIDRPPRVPAGYRSTNHASIRAREKIAFM
jgi:hypothetical protein